jgi:hypothetical protein
MYSEAAARLQIPHDSALSSSPFQTQASPLHRAEYFPQLSLIIVETI